MSAAQNALVTELEAQRSLLATRAARFAALVAELQEQNDALRSENEALRAEIASLKPPEEPSDHPAEEPATKA